MRTSDVPRTFLTGLTRDPGKLAEYAHDPYFRHGWQLAAHDDDECVRRLHRRALLVLKPDAHAGRRSEVVLRALREHGFRVISAAELTFSPLLTRELWRFQFNIASRDRARVVDVLLPAGPSVLLLLEDLRPVPGLPAACRLNGLKGPADPALRTAGDLRTALNSPTTLFNFVHTADEPADVLRESALLDIAAGTRITHRLLAPASADQEGAARRLIARAETEIAAHDLAADPAWRRLVRRHGRPTGTGLPTLAELDRLVDGGPSDEEVWDYLAVATAVIDCNVPQLAPILPTIGPRQWMEVSST